MDIQRTDFVSKSLTRYANLCYNRPHTVISAIVSVLLLVTAIVAVSGTFKIDEATDKDWDVRSSSESEALDMTQKAEDALGDSLGRLPRRVDSLAWNFGFMYISKRGNILTPAGAYHYYDACSFSYRGRLCEYHAPTWSTPNSSWVPSLSSQDCGLLNKWSL